MGAGVPQADLSIIATGEELRLPWVNSQTPKLISMTLERREEFLFYISDFFILEC